MANKQQNDIPKVKITQLNKLLKSVNKLSLRDLTLINLLIELIDNNYVFTELQFGNFIEQICYKNGKLPCYLSLNDNAPIKIITYMFMNNSITENQLTQLCQAIYDTKGGYYIIDILFKQKRDFTMNHFKLLIQLNIGCPNIDNYVLIHNNIIFVACLCIVENKPQDFELFKKCVLMTRQNKMPFNIQHLEIILCCLEMKKINMNNYKTTHTLKILLDALFLNNKDGTEIYNLIIKNKCSGYYNIFIVENVLNTYGCDTLFAKYICDNLIQDKPTILFNLMLKGYKPTTDNINAILQKNANIQMSFNTNFDRLGLTQNKIKNIANNSDQFHTANLFGLFELVPDLNTLNIICEKKNFDNIKYLIEKYNIIPEKSTLDICVLSRDYNVIEYIINYKITPDMNTLCNLCSKNIYFSVNGHEYNYINDIKKIIDLFIFHGLNINNDIIIYLGTKGIFLDNLERFDITNDQQIYFLRYLHNKETCYNHNYTFDNKIIELHKLCSKKSLKYIKLITFLKTNNVKLDRFALDLIYLTIPSLGAKLTTDHNCIPSILTAYNRFLVGPYPTSPRLKITPEYLINKCKLTYTDMFETYDI